MADITITNHGTILLFHATSPAAHRWLREHLEAGAQWFGDAAVVEPRYAEDIIAGATDDGLEVA